MAYARLVRYQSTCTSLVSVQSSIVGPRSEKPTIIAVTLGWHTFPNEFPEKLVQRVKALAAAICLLGRNRQLQKLNRPIHLDV